MIFLTKLQLFESQLSNEILSFKFQKEFQQQLHQEFLQHQQENQNEELVHQIDFALHQHQQNELNPFQSPATLSNVQLLQEQTLVQQPIDLLMSAHSSQSTQNDANNVNATLNGNGMNGNSISNQMQSNFLKENAEMEQMLGDLSATDSDLMQVLKYFETAPTGENLGDLAGGLSLFNDVDVMNIGLDDCVTNSQSKESRAQEMLSDIEKKREKMIRECDFMMRRLRKVQARHMGRHISEEVCGLYEYTQQLIKRKERETKSISTMTPINQLHLDKNKLNTATSWKMLLKRIEHAATNQQSNATSNKILTTTSMPMADHVNNLSSASSSIASANKSTVITCVPQFDANGTQQLKQSAGLLSAELKLIGESFDSDATASSSGGESADEAIPYNNPTQQTLSM